MFLFDGSDVRHANVTSKPFIFFPQTAEDAAHTGARMSRFRPHDSMRELQWWILVQLNSGHRLVCHPDVTLQQSIQPFCSWTLSFCHEIA